MSVPLTVSGFNAGRAFAAGGYDAGLPIYGLYQDANSMFPILSDTIELQPDTPSNTFGLAWYRGLNPAGEPKFAVRDDVALNSKIAYHEAGHAYEETLERAMPHENVMGRYWAFRGFPGTWQQADTKAGTLSGDAGWRLYSSESWAEAFSAAVGGYVVSEWTEAYGKDLALSPGNLYRPIEGALRARTFFLSLMRMAPGFEEDDMFGEADRELLKRVRDLLEAEGAKIWTARGQRGYDVETGKAFDASKPPVDPRIKQ